MKIIYLSTSRLPTEKAYGVTVLESLKAARDLNLDFEIYSPGFKPDQASQKIRYIPSVKLPAILRNRKVSVLRATLFWMNSILIPLAALTKKEFRECKFIWLRDPISAFVLARTTRKKKILVEIHHRPRGLNVFLFRKINRYEHVSFAAISPKLSSQLEKDVPGIKIFVAPMAVPENFFTDKKFSTQELVTRFLYIGKGESSGFDNGLAVLINDFERAIKLNQQISLTFLGLETVYREMIYKHSVRIGLNPKVIKFVDHVAHDQVPEVLSDHDVGILPYPSSSYNNERFPIKSLEYAASGLVILASDIDAHLAIIGQENAYFYTPGEQNSFESRVVEIIENSVLRSMKTANAQNWAEGFTYEKRIQGVVNKWLGNFS
jgi:glycosyltransferase involved in cell wall biosynthesis